MSSDADNIWGFRPTPFESAPPIVVWLPQTPLELSGRTDFANTHAACGQYRFAGNANTSVGTRSQCASGDVRMLRKRLAAATHHPHAPHGSHRRRESRPQACTRTCGGSPRLEYAARAAGCPRSTAIRRRSSMPTSPTSNYQSFRRRPGTVMTAAAASSLRGLQTPDRRP